MVDRKLKEETETLSFACECGRMWTIEAQVTFEEEPIARIGMFDDVCLNCGKQCESVD